MGCGEGRALVGGNGRTAWLEGDAAEGFACDASFTPVVTGAVDPAVLDDPVRLCAELATHGHGYCGTDPAPDRFPGPTRCGARL